MCLGGEPCPSLYRWEGWPAKGREWSPSPTRPRLAAGLEERNSSSKSVPTPLACFPQFLVLAVWLSNWTFDFSVLGFNLILYLGQQEHLVHDAIIPICNDTFMYPFPPGVPDNPEPSRTFPMKTPESFPNSETGLSLYESYSPDHSGSPRDIPDPIRDSEQHSVSFS